MKIEVIPINIWDDFYEDGDVPENEIQETYAYVEDYDISHEDCEKYLTILLNYIQKNIELKGVEVSLFFHDTKDDYDEETVKRAMETYGKNFFFKRWEIKFKYLTHEQLDILVEQLEKVELMYNNIPFEIYSES